MGHVLAGQNRAQKLLDARGQARYPQTAQVRSGQVRLSVRQLLRESTHVLLEGLQEKVVDLQRQLLPKPVAQEALHHPQELPPLEQNVAVPDGMVDELPLLPPESLCRPEKVREAEVEPALQVAVNL